MRSIFQSLNNHVFCYKCNKIYAGDEVNATIDSHPHHSNQVGIDFPGVFVLPDFISSDEENELMTGIDSLRWEISQSGRRKQVNDGLIHYKKIEFEFSLTRFKKLPAELWTENKF